jgi:hypothetical protein
MPDGGLAKSAERDGMLAERESPGAPSLCPLEIKSEKLTQIVKSVILWNA